MAKKIRKRKSRKKTATEKREDRQEIRVANQGPAPRGDHKAGLRVVSGDAVAEKAMAQGDYMHLRGPYINALAEWIPRFVDHRDIDGETGQHGSAQAAFGKLVEQAITVPVTNTEWTRLLNAVGSIVTTLDTGLSNASVFHFLNSIAGFDTEGCEQVRDLMSQARVFDCPLENSFMPIVHESLAQSRKYISDVEQEGEYEAYVAALKAEWDNLLFPFDHCFFGANTGYFDRYFITKMENRGTPLPESAVPHYVGTLVSKAEGIFEIYLLVNPDFIDGCYLWMDVLRTPEAQARMTGGSEEFWISNTGIGAHIGINLVKYVSEFRTIVVERDTDRHAWRQETRKLKKKSKFPMPRKQPFYEITLRDKRLGPDDIEKMKNKERGPLTYRSDVRAHERCLIRRGSLPLSVEKAASFDGRGYDVYTQRADIPMAHLRRLVDRCKPLPHIGEWLAIKVVVVEKFIRGPESAPYIPACRRLAGPRQ